VQGPKVAAGSIKVGEKKCLVLGWASCPGKDFIKAKKRCWI
jgi:hypothetical protein